MKCPKCKQEGATYNVRRSWFKTIKKKLTMRLQKKIKKAASKSSSSSNSDKQTTRKDFTAKCKCGWKGKL